MKNKLLLLLACIVISINFSFAWDDENDWTIIPQWNNWAADSVWNAVWHVWDAYNAAAWSNAWNSFASWVFSWESVFSFFKYMADMLSKIWLVIWAVMIIYAGYKYSTWVFTGNAEKWWQDAIKWAIYGVLIIIFSYAIMKLLMSTFL